MLILSLCDYTGNWSQPYAEAGFTSTNHSNIF